MALMTLIDFKWLKHGCKRSDFKILQNFYGSLEIDYTVLFYNVLLIIKTKYYSYWNHLENFLAILILLSSMYAHLCMPGIFYDFMFSLLMKNFLYVFFMHEFEVNNHVVEDEFQEIVKSLKG